MPLPLALEKGGHAVVADLLEIADKAHAVVPPVAIVNAEKPFTGEVGALVAVSHSVVPQAGAASLEEGALLVSRPAAFAVSDFTALAGQVMRPGQVAAAQSAMHPARGDQFFLVRDLHGPGLQGAKALRTISSTVVFAPALCRTSRTRFCASACL